MSNIFLLLHCSNKIANRRYHIINLAERQATLLYGAHARTCTIDDMRHDVGVADIDASIAQQAERRLANDVGIYALHTTLDHQCRSSLANHFVGNAAALQKVPLCREQLEQVGYAALCKRADVLTIANNAGISALVQKGY